MTRITGAAFEGVRHKFHAVPTLYDGRRYPSKKQAEYARMLGLRVRAGEVLFYLEEVPFRLPGNVTYRLDFLEFWANGEVHCVDTKGVRTPVYQIKKKQVEELYPIQIEEV